MDPGDAGMWMEPEGGTVLEVSVCVDATLAEPMSVANRITCERGKEAQRNKRASGNNVLKPEEPPKSTAGWNSL